MKQTFARVFPRRLDDRVFWGIMSIVVLATIWQALDRKYPTTIKQREVLTPEVAAGDFVKIRYSVVQHHIAEATVYRRLYDGYGISIDYMPDVVPPRATLSPYTAAIPIPKRAEPGPAKLLITTCWARPFNFIHQIWPVCRTLAPVEFAIVKAD